jgi:hypothetical protein
MNAILQQWLEAHAAISSVPGAGILLPEGGCLCHSNSENFPPEKIAKILQEFAGTQINLFEPDLAPRWSTWVFEQGKIRFVPRADGLLLGFAIYADPDDVKKLDRLSAEFLTLTFG